MTAISRRTLTRATISLAVLVFGCGAPAPTEVASPSPSASAAPTTASPLPSSGAPTKAPITPSPTAAPSAPASAAPTPTISPTPTPTASPAPSPTPTPPATTWIGPLSVSTNPYTEIALLVDDAGVVHAAGSLDRSIWYVTNRSGSWIRERLSTPPGSGPKAPHDAQPDISRGGEDLYVAFTRFGPDDTFGALPENVMYVSGKAKNWASPLSIGLPFGNSPSIDSVDGRIYIAYLEGVPFDVIYDDSEFPVRYLTNRTGSWTDNVVSGNGTEPTLRMTPAGRARISFGDDLNLLTGDGLRFASASTPTDGFTAELVPGTNSNFRPHSLSLDANNRAHLVWGRGDDGGVFYARRAGGSWAAPVSLTPTGYVTSISVAADSAGAVHVIATTLQHGVWYFTNRHGPFEALQLLPPPGSGKAFVGSSDIAVDAAGRAHMLFVVGKNAGSTELWYAVSPAV